METRSILIILLGAGFFADTALSLPPPYSEQYAKVRYQPDDDLRKAELNLEKRDREEVTEKNHKPDDKMVELELFQVTTEPESEQISIARYVHRNIVKDKLIQKEEHGSDEGPRASVPLKERKNEDSSKISGKKPEKDREETTSKADLVEQFSPVEIRSDNKENQETSAELYDKSELNDLNQEGPYHIYHPNGSYRKTVFNAENHLTQFQLSSEVNYVPIVESIYTYDPRTFVFQRLLLRT